MEEKLKRLFDFQRFAKNKQLAELINESQERTSFAQTLVIDDDSLSYAAGGRSLGDDKAKEEEIKKDL